ncbi:MAG: GldG family protein [Deltaproteobacteria bacterium]|nr:GldG family protein [Deltaproteobacteria bacterium]
MSAPSFRAKLFKPSLALIALGVAVRLAFPYFAGFYLIPLALGGLFLIVALPGLSAASRRAPRRGRRALSSLAWALAFGLLLLVGVNQSLPTLNVAAPPEASLSASDLALLARLDRDVTIEASLSSDPRYHGPTLFLLDLYRKASPRLKVSAAPSAGRATIVERDGRAAAVLAQADTATVRAENFEETISPITRATINASLLRLVSPNRLVYNLLGDGEKAVLDEGPGGLSAWAESLAARKIFARDYYWREGAPLPAEARAVVLVGPRVPLSPQKEEALARYLAQGGKAMVLLDPLVSSLSPTAFAPLNLVFPEGLVVDQDYGWAGTDDAFIVSQNFPAHPITLGLARPVVFPLSGTVMSLADRETFDEAADAAAQTAAEASRAGAPESAAPATEESPAGEAAEIPTEERATVTVGDGPDAPAPILPIRSHSWAIALSSPASWLETDVSSIAAKLPIYDREKDPAGPLVLATATTIEGGGRLVLAADSDFPSNNFLSFAGNHALAVNALSWLLGAEDDLAPPPPEGVFLEINDFKARLFFFVPVVIWPLLALGAWLAFYSSRQKKGG